MEKNKNKDITWKRLMENQGSLAKLHLCDMFDSDKGRTDQLSIRTGDFLIDYSKNRINGETVDLLIELANSVNITEKISGLLSGEIVNTTEKRPALHSALRSPVDKHIQIGGTDISSQVHNELERIRLFVEDLHASRVLGSSGKPIDRVINIGIGGSDLGPRLVVDALYEYKAANLEVDFVANLDEHDIVKVLGKSDPDTTLFIVTSKSFSTLETQSNALTARQWLMENGCSDIDKHFVAVSSNKKAVTDFGINEERIFDMWDWVGGRYSVWSTVGLPVAIHLGMDRFLEFLSGAHEMDLHFSEAGQKQNIPLVLGLLDVWYNNFQGAETLAVVPYDQRLKLLPEYLSQLIMESNGKGVDEDGKVVDCDTSPVVWGSIGTNAQHAFFQMLHQGTRLVPVEFLLPVKSENMDNHHKLVANCFAQSKALMLGRKNIEEPYRNFPGNRPSTTIIYKELSPRILGMILAMYEHRTFVQAKIWGINPFDQWGVELGKVLANEIIEELETNSGAGQSHDASTAQLIRYFNEKNKA